MKWRLKRLMQIICVLGALVAGYRAYTDYMAPAKVAVRSGLSVAHAKSGAAIDTHLKPVAGLFTKARAGSKAFAEEALSWSGKWNLVVGAFDGKSHREFLAESFARHVLDQQELQDAVEGALRALLADIEGFEAEMLVKLRADLEDPAAPDLPQFRSDEAFRDEYRKALEVVAGELRIELGITVGREVGMLVATELVTRVAMQALRAAAAEMGVSATLLGSGAASMVATTGVGLIISLIIDAMIDEVMKFLGHDPAAKIEKMVVASLDKMEASLLNPGGGTWSSQKRGALRAEMMKLHQARSAARREAIDRMVKEGGR